MTWRAHAVRQVATAAVVAAAALTSSQAGCSSDASSVKFSDVSAGNSSSAGSRSIAGSGGRVGAGGGSSAGGKPDTSGSGTDTGGADTGGADTGGADTGGTNMGGTHTGGAENGGVAGSLPGGAANGGTGGGGGSGGAAGSGGSGGSGACVPLAEVCDGLDNDCDEQADPGGTCPDGCTGARHAGHTYLFCGVAGGAATAQNRCLDYGMVLVAISSEAENSFVQTKAAGSTWLGASDSVSEDRWVWADGTHFWSGDEGGTPVQGRFNAWLDGQPNDSGQGQGQGQEDCAVMLKASAGWNDVSCSSSGFRATCESAASNDPTAR